MARAIVSKAAKSIGKLVRRIEGTSNQGGSVSPVIRRGPAAAIDLEPRLNAPRVCGSFYCGAEQVVKRWVVEPLYRCTIPPDQDKRRTTLAQSLS